MLIDVIFKCMQLEDRNLIEATKCFLKNTFLPSIENINNHPKLDRIELNSSVERLIKQKLNNQNQYMTARQIFMALVDNQSAINESIIANLSAVIKFINKLIYFEHAQNHANLDFTK